MLLHLKCIYFPKINNILNLYSVAIDECLHHNFLIDPLNAKISKEFFVLFRLVSDYLETGGSLNSSAFRKNLEEIANLTKRIVFAADIQNKDNLIKYKINILNFYRAVQYPIDLEDFLDTPNDFSEEED